jgi:four helix bundle protein
MRNFRELNIWKDSVTLSVEIYALIKVFPKEEKFGLSSQMSRAGVSIPSNIAEGCRGSNKELKQYLNIALGSSFELETQLEIAHRVGYVNMELYRSLMDKIQILQKRVNAFRNTIK